MSVEAVARADQRAILPLLNRGGGREILNSDGVWCYNVLLFFRGALESLSFDLSVLSKFSDFSV